MPPIDDAQPRTYTLPIRAVSGEPLEVMAPILSDGSVTAEHHGYDQDWHAHRVVLASPDPDALRQLIADAVRAGLMKPTHQHFAHLDLDAKVRARTFHAGDDVVFVRDERILRGLVMSDDNPSDLVVVLVSYTATRELEELLHLPGDLPIKVTDLLAELDGPPWTGELLGKRVAVDDLYRA